MADNVPIVDGHLHPPLRLTPALDEVGLLSLFTESREAAQLPHVAHTLYFQQALRALAELYGCAPTAAALLQARAALSAREVFERVMVGANVRALLVDDGYQRPGSYALAELRDRLAIDCPVWGVLRVESLVESLAERCADLAAADRAFDAALADLRLRGYAALKSIAAYRTGLQLGPPDREAAASVWPSLHAAARRGGLRLADRAVLEHFLWRAVGHARAQGLPLQLHVGFGDSDLDLLQANPALLRPALEAGLFQGVPLVLLHNYPYLREAGYLASLYPNVYVDLSLTVPMVGPACRRVAEEALELAPASKVLYGSDAAGLVESIWLGARAIRAALAAAAADWVASGALSAEQTADIVERVLWRNAAALYDLTIAR